MNPAIVAAALNQWGLLNGMQNQGNNDQVSVFCKNSVVIVAHKLHILSLRLNIHVHIIGWF